MVIEAEIIKEEEIRERENKQESKEEKVEK